MPLIETEVAGERVPSDCPDWNCFIFPSMIRPPAKEARWRHRFGQSRRTYVLGYSDAAFCVERMNADEVKDGLSAKFAEDPRRYIPLPGWREHIKPDGETFENGATYQAPPPGERKHAACGTWAQMGRDQIVRSWFRSPMILSNALKAISALFDAHDRNPQRPPVFPVASLDGVQHAENEISLHPAIFIVQQFNSEYFDQHFKDDQPRRARFAQAANLLFGLSVEAPILYEMSNGFGATYRTAEALVQFVISEGLPAVGPIVIDYSPRGTHRNHRYNIKRKRVGEFKGDTTDCAIELLQTHRNVTPAG